jgi:hypothetical protein
MDTLTTSERNIYQHLLDISLSNGHNDNKDNVFFQMYDDAHKLWHAKVGKKFLP